MARLIIPHGEPFTGKLATVGRLYATRRNIEAERYYCILVMHPRFALGCQYPAKLKETSVRSLYEDVSDPFLHSWNAISTAVWLCILSSII